MRWGLNNEFKKESHNNGLIPTYETNKRQTDQTKDTKVQEKKQKKESENPMKWKVLLWVWMLFLYCLCLWLFFTVQQKDVNVLQPCTFTVSFATLDKSPVLREPHTLWIFSCISWDYCDDIFNPINDYAWRFYTFGKANLYLTCMSYSMETAAINYILKSPLKNKDKDADGGIL